MKTLKTLFRVLTTYLAVRCYKKLISSEEVTEDALIQIFRNPNIEPIAIAEYHPPYTANYELSRRIVLTKDEREEELETTLKRWRIVKSSPESYTITCTMKRYALNTELILCVLEYREQLTLISGNKGLIVFKQFQWVE